MQALADAKGMTLAELGRHLNISGSTYKDYRDNGMTERVADKRAVQCGLIAWEVWPDMLDHAIEDEIEARRAKKREAQRRYRANNPQARQRDRERHARYMAETREYQNRSKRMRYWSDPERFRAERMRRYYAKKGAA